MTGPTMWAPSPDDVGPVIARLIPDSAGRVTGLFTVDTIPTRQQTDVIIAGVLSEVLLVVPTVPEALQPAARRVVALGAAVEVAVGYFPEAPAEFVARLDAQYRAALALLKAAVASAATLGGPGARAVQVLPIHTLPLYPWGGIGTVPGYGDLGLPY